MYTVLLILLCCVSEDSTPYRIYVKFQAMCCWFVVGLLIYSVGRVGWKDWWSVSLAVVVVVSVSLVMSNYSAAMKCGAGDKGRLCMCVQNMQKHGRSYGGSELRVLLTP